MLRAMPLAGNNGSNQAAVTKEAGEVEDENELALSTAVKHAPPSASSSTLLPRPVASLVTLFAQSTSLSLRVGTYLGGFAIDSARVTTLTGLELSRAVVEGILVRAGRDVSLRSAGEYGRVEAESLLERSLATLHSTITSASFFASASFHLSSVTLTSVAGFSQNLLSTLDAILGSSESSRAIAAIITLIRREFKNPDTVSPEEKVGVGDLLVGSIGFALLQRWGRRATERETVEKRNVEIIWDVVILDNGVRADVLGTQHAEYEVDDGDNPSLRPASFLSPGDMEDEGHFEAIKRNSSSVNNFGALTPHVNLPADRQHELSDDEIRRYIVNQLPPGSRASIRTETVTSRTITVDIFDQDVMDIDPPPGTAVVEESFHHSHENGHENTTDLARHLPKHTVVFRTASSQAQNAQVSRDDARDSLDSIHRTQGTFINSGYLNNKRPHSPQDQEADYQVSGERGIEMRPRDHRTPDIASKKLATNQSKRGTGSLINPEVSSSPFGTGPFSKITQKVKSNTEDKLGHRMPPLRNKSKETSHSNYSTQSPGGAAETESGNVSDRRGAAGFNFKRPLSKVNTKVTTSPLQSQKTSFESPDQISPSLHTQQDSTGSKRPFGTPLNSSANNSAPPQSPSSSRHYSVRQKSVESFVAQTDAYTRTPIEQRPNSPVARHHVRRRSALSRSKSEKEISVPANEGSRPGTATSSRRGSTKSIIPSMYSVTAQGSETSLVLAPRPAKSAYESESAIIGLRRQGQVPGLFPDGHLVKNIHRFCRFSSASYGSNFLRVMGISESSRNWQETEGDHREHSSFSNHTGLPASTILLSSFVDPAGGSNAAGETAQGFPLVHYLAVDHESKAVVLTLRGTWGFEDILTDMTCDYDDLYWLGKTWQVHKGMHASARRLLEGGGGRVMATIKAALEEFSDYGVIFCGHSLGGGVASLLATLIASPKDPDKLGPAFVTASKSPADAALLTAEPASKSTQSGPFCLPANRPIHVYAYGPPAVMSPALQRVTRGLITTIVNGNDVVPTLSLGVLHDFHAVSLAFKSDISGAKSQVRSRVWENITQSIVNKFYVNQPPILINAGDGVGEDSWAWATLRSLRDNLVAPKLLPPGEVFVVETMRVLQRDAFTMDDGISGGDGYPRLGRPATRVQLKFIRDVESRFREIKFGSGMLGDHSPARYEASLSVLARGVLEN